MSLEPLASPVPLRHVNNEEALPSCNASTPALQSLPFEKLPFEMIEEILKKLGPVQRQKLRVVNRLWNRAISSFFVLKLELNPTNWQAIINADGWQFNAVFLGMNIKLDLGHHVRDFETFCLRIRKVEFSGLTHSENIFKVLLKCKSIKKLTLNKAIPVKKNDYYIYQCNTNKIDGFESLPQNWDVVPQDFVSMLSSLSVKLGREEPSSQLDLLEAVTNMIPREKLRKLKIHSVIFDEYGNWRNNSDGGKVIALIHGMTSVVGIPREGHQFDRIVSNLIFRHKFTIQKLVIKKYEKDLNEERSELLDLNFYPRQPESGFRVKTFKGKTCFYNYGDYSPKELGPWLHHFIRQNGLTTLDMNFNDAHTSELFFPDDGPPLISAAYAMYTILPRILYNHSATLTIVKLEYAFYIRKSASFDFSQGFPSCTRLKSLTVMRRHIYLNRDGRIPRISPNFVGISQLPPSLKYLCTNFTIRTEAANMAQLQLSNLKGLETLVYSAHPPFIFNETEPMAEMSLADFNVLRSKLPGLKKVLWGIGEYRLAVEWSNAVRIRFRFRYFLPHKTPTLSNELRKLARRNLEYRKKYGPYHQLKL